MKKLNFELAIKNDNVAAVSIFKKLVISEIGNGFFSVLSKEKKEGEKEGIGFCEENAVFDWVSKNYITEELFSVDDEVRLKDPRLFKAFYITPSESYTVSEIKNVSSITQEFAMEQLSGYEASLIGENSDSIFSYSQLIKLSICGQVVVNKKTGQYWFPGKDFTRAPL